MKNKVLIIIILILSTIVVLGCSNSTIGNIDNGKNIEQEKELYIKYVQELKKIEKSTEELKYDVNVTYDRLDDEEIRYQVIIDNPKVDIKNIKALAIHNKQTDDIFPSIGIFDNSTDLIKEDDKSGIILVGYIPYEGNLDDFECEIKVLISYETKENKVKDYYVTKK